MDDDRSGPILAAAKNVVGAARSAVTRVGLLVAPSLLPAMGRENVDQIPATMDRRDAIVAGYAVLLGGCACLVAEVLVRAIALVTNLAFYGRVSLESVNPWQHQLGYAVIAVPVIGGLIVGLMARFGSRAIRGHGIPEAMEQILTNESKIPVKITFLKPASAAVAIGTGGPFGAEGPIIATGGALGSALGQIVHVSSAERKTLLAAGAAAGMTAIFGTPIAAVLIAIELLLFEYRARSVVPAALAAATAGGLRVLLHGGAAVFHMPDLAAPNAASGITAAAAGALVGVFATYVTRLVYWVEDQFERLPIHWMWWPAIGAIAVGVIGVIEPRTLGVGYSNIEDALSGSFTHTALAALVGAKLVSWAIALGSGTSGGTLAPLLTFGAGIGYLLSSVVAYYAPHAGIDPRVGALVGMTAMFAGASRALMASIAFALESTQQIHAVVPIVAGVSLSYFASCLMMRTTIMTEKLVRRGVKVAGEYDVDPLAQTAVGQIATRNLHVVDGDRTAAQALDELHHHKHQAYPVVRGHRLIGVVTRTALSAAAGATRVGDLASRPPVVARPSETARAAVQRMAEHHVGRIIMVDEDDPTLAIGIISRSDVIAAFGTAAKPGGAMPEGLP